MSAAIDPAALGGERKPRPGIRTEAETCTETPLFRRFGLDQNRDMEVFCSLALNVDFDTRKEAAIIERQLEFQ